MEEEIDIEQTNREDEKNYKDVKTFKDLIDVNLKFLNGEIKNTYYHVRSVDEETIPLLDNLKFINLNGFYSISGQPGQIKHNIYSDYINGYYDNEQKSYIRGFVDNNDPKTSLLIKELKKNDNIYYKISYYENKKIKTNIPNIEYIDNVTRERNVGKEWDYNFGTNIWMGFPIDDYLNENYFPNIFNILKDSIQIIIWCKEYGPQCSVEEILISFINRYNLVKSIILESQIYDKLTNVDETIRLIFINTSKYINKKWVNKLPNFIEYTNDFNSNVIIYLSNIIINDLIMKNLDNIKPEDVDNSIKQNRYYTLISKK
jgi:hypothetical protein